MLTGMGAVATPVEVSELATALATGLVVGQENPLPNIYNLKLYEVQKYVMMTNHMQSVLSVFINEKVWQSIPAADRKIIEDTLAEVGAKTLDWDRETAAKYRADLEAKGMVFVEEKDGLDIAGFQKAVLAQVNKDFPEWTGYIEQIRAVKVSVTSCGSSPACGAAVRWISLALLALLIVTPLAQIVMRGIFNVPMAGAEELARYFLITLTFLSASYVTQQGGQIRMEEFQGLIPPRPRWCLQLGIELAGSLMFGVLFVAGVITIRNNLHNQTATLEMPFWLFMAPLASDRALLVVETLRDVRAHVAAQASRREAHGAELRALWRASSSSSRSSCCSCSAFRWCSPSASRASSTSSPTDCRSTWSRSARSTRSTRFRWSPCRCSCSSAA